MRKLWRWYLGRNVKAKLALAILYTWAVFVTGTGLAALSNASADESVAGVPEAYRIGVQDTTRYVNAMNRIPEGDSGRFCEAVWASGVVGMFEQTIEYRQAYAAGCEDTFVDLTTGLSD